MSNFDDRTLRLEQKRLADLMLTYFVSGDIDWVFDHTNQKANPNYDGPWKGVSRKQVKEMWEKYKPYIKTIGDSVEGLIDDLALIAIQTERNKQEQSQER